MPTILDSPTIHSARLPTSWLTHRHPRHTSRGIVLCIALLFGVAEGGLKKLLTSGDETMTARYAHHVHRADLATRKFFSESANVPDPTVKGHPLPDVLFQFWLGSATGETLFPSKYTFRRSALRKHTPTSSSTTKMRSEFWPVNLLTSRQHMQ